MLIVAKISKKNPLGTCQKLAGGEGGWKKREGHNFLRLQKREGT